MLENEFHKLEEKKEIRTTISQIRKEIKKQDSKKAFLELLQGKESMIVAFLSDEDAKTRKNTALLIGDLKLEQAKDALIAAYLNETTLYVKSAYLTALGKLDVRENLEFFKNRLLEVKNQQVPAEEQKHQGEEIRELNEIILKTEGAKKHQFHKPGAEGGHAFRSKGDRGFGTEKGRAASIGSTGFFERSDSIYKASHLPGIIVSYSHK